MKAGVFITLTPMVSFAEKQPSLSVLSVILLYRRGLLHTCHDIESNNNYIAAGMVAVATTRLSAFLSGQLGRRHARASGGANAALDPSKTFVGGFSGCAAFGERVAQGFPPTQWVVVFPKLF